MRPTAGNCGAGAGDSGAGRAIQNKGSDTLVNLALAWAEAYRQIEPDVSIAVTGGGSGTGIAALINGTVDIANASREMKESEIEEARANGFDPQEFTVAIDALAVIVNQANSVDELTIDQIADIFTGRVTNWQEVGGNDAPIILVSRETNSGTHVYFLEEVLRQGKTELGQRMRANECEWCGTRQGPIEVHHVRRLKDLKGKSVWDMCAHRHPRR
jgi:phosphate transport system substrate-binding protein